ncbi:glycosyltransferase family 2 protein [Ornithinimicrobium kibberense]|uniref:Glycosyltransferase family 2 protein n=2 Tax=Ornithinimicrobium kibberense TaxID=282060 RepID=A0ABV5V6D2_9MICO|nr:glycosyltransferase family 2 protein [Ornithinimicrobium kibberense]
MPLWVVRTLTVLTLVSGTIYLFWRWTDSINWAAWWIGVPLVVAETYTLIDVALFGLTVSRARPRGEPPAAPSGLSVDVFITTYDEPPSMVRATAEAARAITYPHRTWILDDGERTEVEALAAELGVGYLTRGEEWVGRPRHAKAGNVNNALAQTDGEIILILDADQVPAPHILDRTLGWFTDDRVALVQTPQFFTNVPAADPLGSQAPLFYGPIQQGKDGWDAAFFCGSNALLRREALMEEGLLGYVRDTEYAMERSLSASRTVLRQARRRPGAKHPVAARLIEEVDRAVAEARRQFDAGTPMADVSLMLQRHVDSVLVDAHGEGWSLTRSDETFVQELQDSLAHGFDTDDVDEAMDRATHHEWTPEGALEMVHQLVRAISVERGHEAHPVMPLATDSVTEDMATSMRLHALGWSSVYHHEILAHGLAPTDLESMLKQRLRWAQGTVQVALRDNPLTQRGLSIGQKFMYLSTMWSYLSGFAAVVFLAAPVIYLLLGILPVDGLTPDFFVRFVPFLVLSQLLFVAAGWGIPTLRGQQYNMALFPVWIRACSTAAKNVWFGRPLSFVVTRKTTTATTPPAWTLVRPQLIAMVLLVVATTVALVRWAGGVGDPVGIGVNLVWVVYDLAMLGVLIPALGYRGHAPESAPVPAGPRSSVDA